MSPVAVAGSLTDGGNMTVEPTSLWKRRRVPGIQSAIAPRAPCHEPRTCALHLCCMLRLTSSRLWHTFVRLYEAHTLLRDEDKHGRILCFPLPGEMWHPRCPRPHAALGLLLHVQRHGKARRSGLSPRPCPHKLCDPLRRPLPQAQILILSLGPEASGRCCPLSQHVCASSSCSIGLVVGRACSICSNMLRRSGCNAMLSARAPAWPHP